jgi:hypothetical protein
MFQFFFFKNLILIRFKGIETNYLYVYQTKFHLKDYSYELFFTFHTNMKPCDTKKQVTTQENKMI